MKAIFSRNLVTHIQEISRYYPAISLTGPRQAGKTTLLKELFPTYRYLSFEDPLVRANFNEDPRGFLAEYSREVIFDEAQRVPDLFSYLQGIIDEDRTPARFILSGSQNFLLLRNITQSLAGRVGVVRLFPLDFSELGHEKKLLGDPAAALVRGFYPELFQTDLPSAFFYPSYVSTYLERDVTHLVKKGNMDDFRRFMSLCASMVGQTINYSALANSLTVSVPTVKTWMHHLEQSYIAFRIGPYYKNFGKRLVKSPKLYFYDTGLLCYLLQITDAETARRNSLYGSLFENLIVANTIKTRYHAGNQHPLYFYRDEKQLEVDLIEEIGGELHATEIKSSISAHPPHASGLKKLAEISKQTVEQRIVYGGSKALEINNVNYLPWNQPLL